MKSEHVFRHTKTLLWGIAVAFILQIFIKGDAHAQSTVDTSGTSAELSERVEAMSKILAEITTRVENSNSLSGEQKLRLFTQLIEVSQALVTLKRATTFARLDELREESDVTVDLPEVVQPEDVLLHRVRAEIDVVNNTADVTEYYVSDWDDTFKVPYEIDYREVKSSISLTPLTRDLSFARTVNALEDQVVTYIKEKTGITSAVGVDRLTFSTARNPIRDETTNERQHIEVNSETANELFSDFGTRSVIDQVRVNYGTNYASIILLDDQDASFRIAVEKVTHRDVGGRFGIVPLAEPYFTYTHTFFSDAASDSKAQDRDGNLIKPPYKIREHVTNLDEEQILDYLLDSLEGIPFAEAIPNVDKKLLSFLVENRAYLAVSSDYNPATYPTNPKDQCVSDSDRVVLDEFLFQLLLGLRAQYIPNSEIYQYRTRVEVPERGGPSSPRCSSVGRFF